MFWSKIRRFVALNYFTLYYYQEIVDRYKIFYDRNKYRRLYQYVGQYLLLEYRKVAGPEYALRRPADYPTRINSQPSHLLLLSAIIYYAGVIGNGFVDLAVETIYQIAFTIRCKNLSLTANTGVTIPLLSLFTKYNSFQAFMQTYVDVIEFEITLLMKSALAKPFVDKVDVKKFKDVHVQYDLSIPFLSFIIETTIRIVFFVFNDLVKSFIGKLITDMINDLLD
ncbi:hypothetical protein TYRP_016427 [Tyrophagus putrescentiae]|nr:hypothetical protein TYRP_016427 [Tyrophagus putrescentiae]